jgi:hypothetical protein
MPVRAYSSRPRATRTDDFDDDEFPAHTAERPGRPLMLLGLVAVFVALAWLVVLTFEKLAG